MSVKFETFEECKASKKFSKKQLQQLQSGWAIGMCNYADPCYSSEQMLQIKKGLSQKVKVSVYAKPEYGPHRMWLIREALLRHMMNQALLGHGFEGAIYVAEKLKTAHANNDISVSEDYVKAVIT